MSSTHPDIRVRRALDGKGMELRFVVAKGMREKDKIN